MALLFGDPAFHEVAARGHRLGKGSIALADERDGDIPHQFDGTRPSSLGFVTGIPTGGNSSTRTHTHTTYPHPPSGYGYGQRVLWVPYPLAYPQRV